MAAFAAPAWADRPLGLDVSTYTPLTTTEWAAIRNSGRVFGFARATWGCAGCAYGGTDDQFVNHMTNGQNAGLYMGAYHFEYAGYDSNHTPINEANNFLNVARNYITGGYLRPVLDVEYASGNYMGGLTLTQWVNQWMDYVQQQTGVEPLIYTGAYFARDHLEPSINTRDLWIANWSTPDPQNGNPYTAADYGYWSTWCFWQYAGDVTIPGVTNQKVDLDVFKGTLTQLQSFVITSSPVISHQPSTQNVCPGATATFTVGAMGSPPLTYQWKKAGANVTNGGHYSGCTTATLTVSSCNSNDLTNYSCQVTNSYGNATSNTASLTLKATTAITLQPSDQGVLFGGTATFTVAGTGSGTLTYQWQKSTVNITNGGHYSGCTTATLTISNANLADLAGYRCVVAGDCGSVTSSTAFLTTGRPGDFDQDGDVDQVDFGVFQNCLGIIPSVDPNCGGADLNGDNIINWQDLNRFVGCMSGSRVPGNPNCLAGP